MRRTVMVSGGGDRLTVETGDTGTVVLDGAGMVLAEHGSDRHDEMVALRREAGWGLLDEAEHRPQAAEGDPPPPDGPAGPAGEVEAGPSS